MGTALGIGIGIPFTRRSGGGGLSPEALAWKARIIANGGTIPDATLAIIDEELIKPSLAGGIWAELDRLNIYCGLVGYEIAARTNLIKSAHYVTPVSSPTFDNNGYKSSGTSYLDLNYNPSTEGVKFEQNSNLQFCIVLDPVYIGSKRHIGGANFSGTNPRIDHLRQGDFFTFQSDSTASINTNIVTSGNVFLGGRRTAASGAGCKDVIINSNVQSYDITSTILPNISLFELSVNYDGTPSSDVDTNYHRCSGHGSSAVDYATLRTLLNNTITALGV
jgi:hypothetical protein